MQSPPKKPWYSAFSRDLLIAAFALAAIAGHLLLRYGLHFEGELYHVTYANLPLIAALVVGGLPLVVDLLKKIAQLDFSSDILAGISIVTAVLLGEYLAGTIVVLMLSGGQALESYAVRKASSALEALAERMPSTAHRQAEGAVQDVPLADVAIGDLLIVFPHETCPVDAVVVEGHSTMDESYLTGEPYVLSKVVGSQVLSGAINGEGALTIRAEQTAVDSRYAKIMQVMRDSEQRRRILAPARRSTRRVLHAASGRDCRRGVDRERRSVRFLAVMVVATPCPLLIAIPVAIIGSISLAARRGIIVKDPAVLEKIDTCRTAIFDKTGTLTYGQPKLDRRAAARRPLGRGTRRDRQPRTCTRAIRSPPRR
jgi:cation transport ATPase